PFDDYVAICLVIKNQHEDLSEWLVHHYYHLGIRNFYIMDDGSSPPLESIKNTFGIPISTLTFEYLDTSAYKSPPQLDIYTRCISQYGDKHTWMAFLSPNEFLEITEEGENLAGILLDLEQDDGIGALAVNWQMHTSSGLLKRPDSTRKAFVECIWDDVENGGKFSNNTHVKSIVRTEKVLKPKNFYTWVLKDGAITVGEDGDEVTGEEGRLPITREKIALHHYAGKSREEFEAGMGTDGGMREGEWNSLENMLPHVPCPEMAAYTP
ncbi:hypothetical protein BGZ60DRAFT_376952, partial [Tricladium varicosporioides]